MIMKKEALKEVLIELIPFLLALIIAFYVKQEIAITIILAAVLLISFKMKYHKKEGLLLFTGIITGLIFEISGNFFYKLQYWSSGSIYGMPLWIPLLWGYGFILIRRIGNIIVRD